MDTPIVVRLNSLYTVPDETIGESVKGVIPMTTTAKERALVGKVCSFLTTMEREKIKRTVCIFYKSSRRYFPKK